MVVLVRPVLHSIVRQTHLMTQLEMVRHGTALLLHLVSADPAVVDDLLDELKVPGVPSKVTSAPFVTWQQSASLGVVSPHGRLAVEHDQIAALAPERASLVPRDVLGGGVLSVESSFVKLSAFESGLGNILRNFSITQKLILI